MWCPPIHMENGRPIHLENDGRQPSPREGGLGLEWTGPEQGTRRGKKGKGRQSWLESLVCRLHRLVKGTLAHTTISTHHCALTGSPRQQSRNQERQTAPCLTPCIQEASGFVDATLSHPCPRPSSRFCGPVTPEAMLAAVRSQGFRDKPA